MNQDEKLTDEEKRQCLISPGEMDCKCESCKREKGKYAIAIVDGKDLLWETCLCKKCFNAFAEASAHYILE